MEQNNQPNMTPTPGSKKSLWISGVIIIVAIALLIVGPRLMKTSTTEAPTDTDKEIVDTTTSDTAPKPLSRADALIKYAGKTVTVTGDCKISPETQTVANGTTVLIDNNTGVSHTVAIGSKSYTVSGQHYTLSWQNSIGTVPISCDGKASTANIIVQ